MKGPTRLDRAVELTLTSGLVTSGLLLVLGLLLGRQDLLRGGAILLMLTPVARVVVVTIALFARRDVVFGGISLWILVVLTTSLAVSLRL